MKMRKTTAAFALCLLLSSCSVNTSKKTSGGNSSSGNNQKLCSEANVTSSTITFVGNVGNVAVSSSMEKFDFAENIVTSTNATWKITTNPNGFGSIGSKEVELDDSKTTVYLVVTAEDKSITKIYTINISKKALYTITFDTNGGTPLDSASVEEGTKLGSSYTTSKDDYNFTGWTVDGTKVDSNYVITSDVTLVAQFSQITYTITMDASGYTYTGESSYQVAYGESFTFPVASKKDTTSTKAYCKNYTFKGWKYNGVLITDEKGTLLNEWSMKSGATLTPEIVEDGICFGTYPQSEVEATAANGLANIDFDSSTWTAFNFYSSGSLNSFNYYKDVDADGDGNYDYRGVYLQLPRPSNTESGTLASNSYQDENGYPQKSIYWFSYDPIVWKFLDTVDGKSLIVSKQLIDSMQFYNSNSERTVGETTTIYPNNYKESDIRTWLNDSFYSTAFNSQDKLIVNETTVDNSKASTGYNNVKIEDYICEDTLDNIFLLSRSEMYKSSYFDSVSSRKAFATDYSKCMGIWVSSTNGSSNYWVRSPYYDSSVYAFIFTDFGDDGGKVIRSTATGVRPACWITL